MIPPVLVAIGIVVWTLHAIVLIRVVRTVPVVERMEAPPPPVWPKVSIVVPARDEVRHIEPALASKLAQDYPDLEIVVVDDRSTDGTGPIVDAVAARDERVTAIHVADLPSEWLGKLYAMHCGVAASSGQWLLFSDADVHLAPDTLRTVIAWAEARGVDHVGALPTVWSRGVALDAVMATMVRLLLVSTRAWSVGDAASSASFGCGAFNLVRRSAYDRTPGLEWLRMEIGDDIALGQMLKRAGARQAMVNGRGAMGLEFYTSVGDMARKVEKVAGVAAIGPRGLIAGGLVLWSLELAPFLALVWPTTPLVLRLSAAAVCVLAVSVSVAVNRWVRQPSVPALLVPLGTTTAAWLFVRTGVLALLRGGIYWRERFYTLKALREGARYRLR